MILVCAKIQIKQITENNIKMQNNKKCSKFIDETNTKNA